MMTFWYRNDKYANEEPTSEEEKPDHEVRDLTEVIQYLSSQ